MKIIKKILKITFKVILILIGVSVLFCLCIIPFDNKVRKEIEEMTIKDVDLNKIGDGKYIGHFKNQLRTYNVEVTVEDHTIINIKPAENSVSNSYSEKIFNKVIEEQKVNVDTISGATITSKMILKAIEDALDKDK